MSSKELISAINYNLKNIRGNKITCLTVKKDDDFNIIDIHTFCKICGVHITNRAICRSNYCKFAKNKKYKY